MEINSLTNIASQGLQQSQQRLTETASDIARAATEVIEQEAPAEPVQNEQSTQPVNAAQESQEAAPDLVESALQLNAEQQVFDAQANVLSVADETLGALLDTQA